LKARYYSFVMILRVLKFGVILSLSGRAVYCFWLSDSLGCNFY
jgi:hypothetical protein